jgi:N-methylhydantoinase A
VTNALLEGKGARTAFVTTRGMRDVLELRRSARASLYDLFQDGPAVLVPRHLRLEVTRAGRRAGRGGRATAVDELDDVVDFIKRHDVEAVAVCLLYSFLNDGHEREIGDACAPLCPTFRSSCRARCFPRSASSSARARPPCAPTSRRH